MSAPQCEEGASAEYGPGKDRPPEIPLTEFQQNLEKVVERLSPLRVRHACRSAFSHLRHSWALHPIDSEMSLFRAITAEEEAATALLLALKHQRYPGAQRLNHRDHRHKAAIWPFIRAIGEGFAKREAPTPQLHLALEAEPFIEFSYNVAKLAGLPTPFWAKPDHPFNFVLRSDVKGPFEIHAFEQELQDVAESKGAGSIVEHVEAEANLRNELLYASEHGIPAVAFKDGLILGRAERVAALVIATIGVMQTPVHQLFVVQCLEALLKALNRMEGEGYDYPTGAPIVEATLSLEQQPDKTMKLSILRPMAVTIGPWGIRYPTWPGTWT